MSVAGIPVQLISQTFDFALICAIKGFWKQYKPTFSHAQLISALQENEQKWLAHNQRNCNNTTYRASVHLSLQGLVEHAGIIIHRNVTPQLYELVNYTQFQEYEKEIITSLYDKLIQIEFAEHLELPFMSERSYQHWLLKQHTHNNLNYSIKTDSSLVSSNSPCLKALILTELQLHYLIKKAIRYNLVQFPTFTNINT